MTGQESIVLPDGSVRRLGNIAPRAGLVKAWPVFGATPDTPLIPRSEWKARCDAVGLGHDFRDLPPQRDQDGIGECNCDATMAAVESQRVSQGLPQIDLSAGDLYDRINGGSDNGSLLEDALREMTAVGVGTVATCGANVWHRRWTPAPASERARFKVLKAYLCPTFDHVFSAVLQGRRMISGVEWFDNYAPGPDGWLPRGRGMAGGHAIFGFKPTYRGSGSSIEYGVWHRQSWGKTWAPQTDNCFVLPESAYGGGVGGWWALGDVTDEGGQVPTP